MTDLSSPPRAAGPHPVRAPRGTQLHCKNWLIEAAYRMLQNNLDPEVAENPDALVVYGGIGKAARDWDCYEAILRELQKLGEDETLLVQSGKPVGVFRTHADAPRVLIANSNLVPKWATWEHFHELDRKGLMMYGQMTAGSWIYIGSQGIVQGTYETFVEASSRASTFACARATSTSRPATWTTRWPASRSTQRSRRRCRSACSATRRASCRRWPSAACRAMPSGPIWSPTRLPRTI